MPIVSSTLKHIRPQRDGRVRVTEQQTDSHGRPWSLTYKLVVQTDAAAVQAFVAAAAVHAEANARFAKAKRDKKKAEAEGDAFKAFEAGARMVIALADAQAAIVAMEAPHAALSAVAETEATAAMNARDYTEQLKDAEENDAVDFIEAGGDPDAFVKDDLTTAQFRRRIAKRFAQSNLQEHRPFMCRVATWVAGFSSGQIANALGISNARATAIRNRAIELHDTICPALLADDGAVEDID